jgi:dimethylaniline monooxygenase (N-oxide forming)
LHPTARETAEYLESFADHFELRKYIKFSTTVTGVSRNEAKNQWIVETRPTNRQTGPFETKEFDMLILCTSPHGKPTMPAKFKDLGPFEGEVVHSREFKNPYKYKGKNVVVVGTSATAVDTIEFCRAAGAKKVYMSHRRAIRLVSNKIAGAH